ncbi:unnamed protein product [Acanthoscelides obtectus]|uniref:Uncharacterized protein n=1 Tax=Acanthoscelides obtectus TaxID=200917 RepID=A0A9P0KH75_ACAOB|nr:unnamed protein product [Acanthoscelides obtectus]CAK1635725.1 hypothetical protein AOBTE_LOCUS9465 [Acanthoscelides obtectus]
MAGDADFESTLQLVMRQIYTSCDVDNTNRAPISQLIEFIKPHMLGDLSALDHLKYLLEFNNEDGYISSEVFYSVMTQWAKKVANSDHEDFNDISPNNLDTIDEKHLPYTQSTPRASFGQKLLSSECLLNISGASANLSVIQSKDTNTVGKTTFEDQINRLEYQLNKCTNELEMVKLQLAASEEHNENLQADLERCKTRLMSEQQVNEHLQKNKAYCEELKDEICQSKKEIESLRTKLQQCEKDRNYMSTYVKDLEQEIGKLENRCKQYVENEQRVKSELCDIRAELDNNEQKMIELNKANEGLKAELNMNKTKIIDLTSENNELLDYRTHNLEKTSARRFSSSTAYAPRFSDSFRGTVPIYSSVKSLSDISFDEKPSPVSPITPACLDSTPHRKSARVHTARRSFDVGGPKVATNQTAPLPLGRPTSCLLVRSASECSNLVQDIGSEEELSFGYQTNVSLLSPCMSLQAELSQVNFPIDEATREYIESLKSENRALKTKFEELTKETDHLYKEISKLEENIEQLEKAVKKSELDRDELEKRYKNTNGNSENALVAEIQNKLAKLQDEYAELQRKYASKELEVEEHNKKFNFEVAYKNAQKELNEKCQMLANLQKETNDYKSTICKLTTDNRSLETAMEELNKKLKKAEDVSYLNKNIEDVASQVQTHIDRKNEVMGELAKQTETLRDSIKVLEDKLRDKDNEVENLEKILKSQENIKNIMWRDNSDLRKQIEVLTVEKQKLTEEVHDLTICSETINNEVTSFHESTQMLCDKIANLTDENKKLEDRVMEI